MITITLIALSFLGGVYVGARYADKIRSVWYSIFKN